MEALESKLNFLDRDGIVSPIISNCMSSEVQSHQIAFQMFISNLSQNMPTKIKSYILKINI